MIDLWNIRQFHPRILAISLPWLQDARDFLAEFLRANYRPLPRNPHGVMIRTTIQFRRSISKELAEVAVQQAGLPGSLTRSGFSSCGMIEFGSPIATILSPGQNVRAFPQQEPTWSLRCPRTVPI